MINPLLATPYILAQNPQFQQGIRLESDARTKEQDYFDLLRQMSQMPVVQEQAEQPMQFDLKGMAIGGGLAGLLGGAEGANAFLQGSLQGQMAKKQQDDQRMMQHLQKKKMEQERELGMLKTEAEIANSKANRALSRSQEFQKGAQADKLLRATFGEKEYERKRKHGEFLLKQFQGAKDDKGIRSAGQALQAAADKDPESYGEYAPTPKDVEDAVAAFNERGQEKALKDWQAAVLKVPQVYGMISEKNRPALETYRAALAKRHNIQNPDEFFPIITGKSLGMQKLDEEVRSSDIAAGEKKRHNLQLEKEAEKRIGIQAESLEIARGRLGVAQQNANTYRGMVESRGGLQSAQMVWANANNALVGKNGIRAQIAGLEAVAKPTKEQEAKLEQLRGEAEYWEALKQQASMTADEAREMQEFMNSGGMLGNLGGMKITLPPGESEWIPPGAGNPLNRGPQTGPTAPSSRRQSPKPGEPGSGFNRVR